MRASARSIRAAAQRAAIGATSAIRAGACAHRSDRPMPRRRPRSRALLDNRNALGLAVHAAGGGAAAAVPDLSARPRHLARLHRRQDRARPASGSASRTTSSSGATSVTRLALFNTLFYTIVASVIKFVLGLWLALLLNKHLPFKALLPRHRAAAVHRADGAVGDRLLVDLRRAVLDHQLGADEDGPDRRVHRLPRRPVERALLGDRRQRLARRALRRDHAAGRPADDLAVVLRGGEPRRRHRRGSSSATSRCRC